MKKVSLFLFLCCMFVGYGMAQNIQLHYDFGHTIYESLEDLSLIHISEPTRPY